MKITQINDGKSHNQPVLVLVNTSIGCVLK